MKIISKKEELAANGNKEITVAIGYPLVCRLFATKKSILDLSSSLRISSVFVKPILFSEIKPDIISNGFRYDGSMLFL